jgi:succinoglycan biosynthesis transport protein ExoP
VLVREVDSARRSLEGVNARLQNTSLESQAQTANIAALESARAPSYPSAPRTFSNIALGLVAAAVVALVAALVVELRDRRLRTLNEVEAWLGQPLLGAIPAFKKPGKKDQPSELTLGLSSRLRPALRALPHSA